MMTDSPLRPDQPVSLRNRLILGAVALILVLGTLAIIAIDGYGKRAAELSYDRLLASAAFQIADAIHVRDGVVDVDLPVAAFETLALARDDRVFYRISGPRDAYLTGYADLPRPAADQGFSKDGARLIQQRFFTSRYLDEPVRFIVLRRLLTEADITGYITVQLGQTINARADLAEDITGKGLQLIAIASVIALGLLGYGIKRAFSPLDQIERELAARSPTDLTPLHVTPIKETWRLQQTINHFMRRLQDTLDRMQRYTGEAAHQIRTPLAGLRAALQNLRDHPDIDDPKPVYNRIMQSVDQLNTTVSQLLNQATITHRLQSEALRRIELNKVVKEACLELASHAINEKVELAFEADAEDTNLLGDAFALKQLFRNLIENAVRYSPVDGVVEIRVHQSVNRLFVEVKDNGPGIPVEYRDKVFTRFYRAPAAVGVGSGLGLAIVREIAERHNAEVGLMDNQPHGLTVRVGFRKESAHGK
ncbi:sensor histidine kinase [Hahella sp. HN01]|uniref:sensor histidine kinase n=1 Tax=Hahella sp. HN01 TaxID=2847262 RepID=UPI001C1EFB5F|nr:sensor histidine kinase [Hahella sp. HN01]MBU6954904.1 sensor histidine kinase N-terminal domain-containing protein [Hahella sp. HN01]